jgi:hypothetical protein
MCAAAEPPTLESRMAGLVHVCTAALPEETTHSAAFLSCFGFLAGGLVGSLNSILVALPVRPP